MLHKKQIWAIFLFKFKMGHKITETTLNINTFDPGTANKCAVQWCFKKFHKGDESLEDEERCGQPSGADKHATAVTDGEDHQPHPVITTREAAKGRSANRSTVQHLKQSGKVKKLSKWVPHELKIKNIIILKCHLLLLYATTTNHFSIRLWYVMKSGFYITTSNSQLSGWTKKNSKAPPKAKAAPRKGHSHWWSTACLFHDSFLNLGEIIISEKYVQQSMRCTENCNAGSQHRSTEKGPVLRQGNARPRVAQPALQLSFRSWTNGATKFCLIRHIHLTSFNWLPRLQASRQLFAGKKLPQPAAGTKCFSRVCRIPNHRFLRYRNERAYFLLATMCWLYNQTVRWFLFWLIKMCLSLVMMI